MIIINKILNNIYDLCKEMPNIILDLFDSQLGDKYDCFILMVVDAYKDLLAYTNLVFEQCWSQAAAILRLSLERISKVCVICLNPGLIEKFIERNIQQYEYRNMNKKEKEDFLKRNKIGKTEINNFFDYGWADTLIGCKQCSFYKMLELAELGPAIDDIKYMLNNFVHGKLSAYQINDGTIENKYQREFCERCNIIAFCLFSRLYISTKNIIKNLDEVIPSMKQLNNKIFNFVKNYRSR